MSLNSILILDQGDKIALFLPFWLFLEVKCDFFAKMKKPKN
jgi:hypothetical protein